MKNEDMLMVPTCFLFIIHAYIQLRRVMKRQPQALAFLFVLQSVLIFLCFSSYYSLCNDKQFINPFARTADCYNMQDFVYSHAPVESDWINLKEKNIRKRTCSISCGKHIHST